MRRKQPQRYLIELKDDGFVYVHDQRTNKARRFLVQAFIYGQGLYEEATAKYPNYVHSEVWRLQRLAQASYCH